MSRPSPATFSVPGLLQKPEWGSTVRPGACVFVCDCVCERPQVGACVPVGTKRLCAFFVFL